MGTYLLRSQQRGHNALIVAVYRGGEGIDFNVNLNISTIDFGTFHVRQTSLVLRRIAYLRLIQLYPESWGQSANPSSSVWGSQWISDHATSQKSANKPVIMEEFGVTDTQLSTYTTWYSNVISTGLTGDLIWYVRKHVFSVF